MSFLYPSYLWAFAGLVVPIAIHLWSKKEAKTIKIGSVQLLSESNSRQSSSIQLNEWWLLLLRMLIISLLTLSMARPQWHSKIKNTALMYMVEPSLMQHEGFKIIVDSLAEDHEVRVLTKGFPTWNSNLINEQNDKLPKYWQLASEMDNLQADSIVVFTNAYVEGLHGMRPETSHPIHWVVIDSGQIVERPLVAYQNQEKLRLFIVSSGAYKTRIHKEAVTVGDGNFSLTPESDSLIVSGTAADFTVPIISQNPIKVSLFYADSLMKDKMYLEAAFSAIATYLDRKIEVVSKPDSVITPMQDAALTIWLSTRASSISNEKLVFFEEDSLAKSLIEPGIKKDAYRLTGRITTENAVSQRLTEQLMRLLEVYGEVGQLAPTGDRRSIAETELRTNHKAKQQQRRQLANRDMGPYMWILLLVLLGLERILAYKRRQ